MLFFGVKKNQQLRPVSKAPQNHDHGQAGILYS